MKNRYFYLLCFISLKIIIDEPQNEENKIGKFLPKTYYNWSKTYVIYLDKYEEIEQVVRAIIDSVDNRQ
ncbi:hypothetical protein NXS15_01500 [Mycoplasma sp. CSL7475-4]|uniref:hypothetical protein n=1 Tax=Mycoplasma sp. CSL7475-4 TaxID=2973942 RepID=UPI00216B2FAD|nr:hypothetical protein [Mycoplasma sp. CSL7475-4]MCS4536799.1 hypothetical protein [Mycoplasma sp. CSL7475-4]